MDTARLHIRPFTLEDAVAAHAVYGDLEVMRHRRQAYGHEHVLYRADNPEGR